MKLELNEHLAVLATRNVQVMDFWQSASPSREGGGDEAVAGKKNRSTTGKEKGSEK